MNKLKQLLIESTFLKVYLFIVLGYFLVQFVTLLNHPSYDYRDFDSYYYAAKNVFTNRIYEFHTVGEDLPLHSMLTKKMMEKMPMLKPDFLPFAKELQAATGLNPIALNRAFVFPYLYPPVLAFYIYPLTLISKLIAFPVWHFLLYAFYFLALVVAIEKLSDEKINLQSKTSVMFFLLLLFFVMPMNNSLYWSQVNGIVLGLFTIAIFKYKDSPILASSCMAFSILIKMSPALFLVYFFLKKEFRFLLYTFLSSVVIIIPTLFFKGITNWIHFFKNLPNISFGEKAIMGTVTVIGSGNHSLKAFVYKVLPWDFPHLSYVHYICGIVLLLFSLFVYFRMKNVSGREEILIIQLNILLIILSPMTWYHHLVFLFPSVVLLFVLYERNKQYSLLHLGFLAVIFYLIFYPVDVLVSHNLYIQTFFESFILLGLMSLFFYVSFLGKKEIPL